MLTALPNAAFARKAAPWCIGTGLALRGRMKSSTTSLHWFGLLSVGLLAACGAADEGSGRAAREIWDDESASAATEPNASAEAPDQFTDPQGGTWTKVGPAKFVEGEWRPPQARKASKPSSELTLEEFAAKLRPRMESGGYEYRLDWESTLELARAARAQLAEDLSVPGSEAFERSSEAMGAEVGGALQNDSLQATAIGMFGGESRTKNTNGGTPWKRIGMLKGGCTVSKIYNEYTAVTAAHCVHSGSGWSSRKDIVFAAGTDNVQPTLNKGCYDRTVPEGWDGSDGEWDMAILRLRSDTAGCKESGYDVGWFGWHSVGSCESDVPTTMAGYPAKNPEEGVAPPGNWSYPTMFREGREDTETSCLGLYPSRLWHYHDSCDGMSGAPLWSVFDGDSRRIRGILTVYDDGVFYDSNEARRVNSDFAAFVRRSAGY